LAGKLNPFWVKVPLTTATFPGAPTTVQCAKLDEDDLARGATGAATDP
jgi:hypothetical protein